ncbi:MAG: hypothetical protein WEC75_06555 [Dehalococcoidia bacterium]
MRPTPLRKAILAIVVLALPLAALTISGCGGGSGPSPASPTASPSLRDEPGRATLHGMLTLDGAPFDAPFLGVRVVRDGLAAACQANIPAVERGAYRVGVADDADARGCGAPGGELLLWVYVNDGYLFSNQTTPWPGNGADVAFDATFSSASPRGAARPVTEFKGLLFDREGDMLPAGSVVEAYAGETLCGMTSMRYGDVTEGYFTLVVAGPEMVVGCAEGATLQFRVNDQLAAESAINDLGQGSAGHELNLSLR